MTWLSALADWFSPSAKRRRGSRHAERLVAQQLALAEDIERTREALDRRLQELAGRLYELGGEEAEDELRSLETAQASLRLAVLRLDASATTTQELARELKEWEDRGERERAEILRSELAVREPAPKAQRVPIMPETGSERMNNEQLDYGQDQDPEEHRASFIAPDLDEPETEHLVRAIREATREAERWHAAPEADHDEELLDQLHHVRELHAMLKQLDREQGTDRDRVALAVNTRDIH